MIASKEPSAFMIRIEVKTLLNKEKEKTFASTFGLGLKAPYPLEVEAKFCPSGHVVHNSRSLTKRRETHERMLCGSSILRELMEMIKIYSL